MELASQQPPAQQPVTGNRAFRLAHWVSDTVNSLRLKTARRWDFVPQTVAYQGYGSTTWVRVLGRVVLTSKPHPGSRAEQAAQNGNQNIRGWRAFTSVPVQYSEVEIEIGGVTARVHADRGGLVDTVVQVELTPGWHTAVLRAEGTEPATAKIFVISPDTKLGIVSDIDDTIMVTALPRPFLALWNTFVLNERARMATPGMAVLMDRLDGGIPGGPGDLPVHRAVERSPHPGPLHHPEHVPLRRPAPHGLGPHPGPLVPQRPGAQAPQPGTARRGVPEHALAALRRQRAARRSRSTPHFAQQHGDRVAAIGIRQLSASEAVLAGGHSETGDHTGSQVPWIYSPDGAGMAKSLQDLDLL